MGSPRSMCRTHSYIWPQSLYPHSPMSDAPVRFPQLRYPNQGTGKRKSVFPCPLECGIQYRHAMLSPTEHVPSFRFPHAIYGSVLTYRR